MRRRPRLVLPAAAALLAVLLAAAALPAAPLPSRALEAEGEITMKARHALGGIHRPTGFIPVAVELDNPTSEDRVLTVLGGAGNAWARRRVELPAHARKALTLYLIPEERYRRYTLRLEDEEGEVLARRDLTSVPIEPHLPLVGVVGSEPIGTRPLRTEGGYRVVLVDPRILPGRPEGLRGLDALIWNDPRLGDLSPEQVLAVSAWTEAGGLLVLSVNDVWLESSTGGLEVWTGIRARGIRTVRELPRLGAAGDGTPPQLKEPLSVATFYASAGEVWLEELWGPLAVTERRGRGRVVVLGFDPSDRPLARWQGMAAFWRALLGRAGLAPGEEGEHAAWSVSHRYSNPYGGYYKVLDLRHEAWDALSRVEGQDPPPLALLLSVLLLYLVLIGPVDYFVLRWAGRLSWTWVTYPALVALFTVGTYTVATHSRSGQAFGQHQLHMDLLPHSDLWAEELHGAFLAARAGTYRVGPGEGGGIPLGNADAADESRLRGRWGMVVPDWAYLEVRSDQGGPFLSARVPKWGTLAGTFLRHTPARGARLEAELRQEGRRLRGRLVPRLGRDLEAGVVLLLRNGQPWMYETGPLHDGVPLTLDGLRAVPLNRAVGRYGDRYASPEEHMSLLLVQTARRLLLGREPDFSNNQPEFTVLLRSDPHPRLDWSRHLEDGGAVLVAWGRDPVTRLRVEGEEVRGRGVVFLRVAVPPEQVKREALTGEGGGEVSSR